VRTASSSAKKNFSGFAPRPPTKAILEATAAPVLASRPVCSHLRYEHGAERPWSSI
jgi:hypothetical protein